jgi:hypothetical protein
MALWSASPVTTLLTGGSTDKPRGVLRDYFRTANTLADVIWESIIDLSWSNPKFRESYVMSQWYNPRVTVNDPGDPDFLESFKA